MQVQALQAAMHLVVATPGRLLDLLDAGSLSLGGSLQKPVNKAQIIPEA